MASNSTIRKEPRIKPAENGLILEWTEYIKSDKCYDGCQYLGSRMKLFAKDEGQQCVDELFSISEEEAEHSKSVASRSLSFSKTESY